MEKLGRYELHPVTTLFSLLEGDAYDALFEDIRKNGLLVPIVLTRDGRLLDGRARLRACLVLGHKPVTTVYEGDDPLALVVSLNLRRRHLSESQRAMVGAEIAALQKGVRADTQDCGSVTQGEAAAFLNVGVRSIQLARHVRARGVSEIVALVKNDKLAVFAAAQIVNEPPDVQREFAQRLKEPNTKAFVVFQDLRRRRAMEVAGALPDGKYRVIYADPPWPYENTFGPQAAETHYATMALDELMALPVASLAADDSVLFCWATFPKLLEALEVVKAWDFTYKAAFVWAKDRHCRARYNDASAELLLVCTRGSCTPDSTKLEPQVHHVPRPGEHSQKPEHFRELIDRLYLAGPRVDLFARGPVPSHWKAWGNEAGPRAITRHRAASPQEASRRRCGRGHALVRALLTAGGRSRRRAKRS